MAQRHVVVGVTGSVGAYKAADLVRRLRERACAVTCVLTADAAKFITPVTLQALSERKVYTELFDLEEPAIVHTRLADEADVLAIVPATANVIGKLAHGLADDLLTCLALATTAPVVLAPAMNVHMYEHPAVRDNLKRLRAMGHRIVEPCVGRLACGYEAVGHLAELDDIVRAVLDAARAPRRPSSALRASERPLRSRSGAGPSSRPAPRRRA